MYRSQCVSKGAMRLIAALVPAVLAAQQPPPPPNQFNITQTISDEAQRTTLAFDALGMMTGNLYAQSFFPPGKVADYTGFQYLRDNDPDNMGHNTSFLTRVANNIIYILNDSQFAQLKTLAVAQNDQIDLYGYKRYPLMKAFRRLLDGDTPASSSGLSLAAVKQASRELYLIDGQISFDRALLYANVIASMTSTQRAYLDVMKGKGWKSWPDIQDSQIQARMATVPQGGAVAVMTYASDLYSWYAGSLDADVYFCPERHGTYYGGFYIKDAPAVGHEGYSISEQLTATAGAALSDASLGYVTSNQAALISSLVSTQRNNLYAGSPNIVQTRTYIASLLRTLLVSTINSDAVKRQVLDLSATYGELDGENNYNYATIFAKVYKTFTADQKTKLAALRKSIMSGVYADGTPFDYSLCTTPFLYSSVISDMNALSPYISNTDYLFSTTAGAPGISSFTASPASVSAGSAVTLSWSVTGAAALSIDNGVGTVTGATSKSVTPNATTTYTLTATNAAGSTTAKATVTVTPTLPVIASFTASPAAVKAGSPATLTWNVTGATTLSIDNGVGAVTGATSKAVTPAATTTYTLTATNAGGSTTAKATVTVTPALPVITSFKALPAVVKAGSPATLTWNVTGATALSIDNGVGSVTGATSKLVSPSATTSYTLIAASSSGITTATVTVTVQATDTVPPTAPSLLQPTVRSTDVTLTWNASMDNIRVTEYRVFRDGSAIASVPGTTFAYVDKQVTPNTRYTYTVRALDAAGNVSPPSNPVQATTPAPPPGPQGQPR